MNKYSFAKKSQWVLLFLKAFSWGTNLEVTLSDFMLKNAKPGRKFVFIWKEPLSGQQIVQGKFAALVPVFPLSLSCNGIKHMSWLVAAKYTVGQSAVVRQMHMKIDQVDAKFARLKIITIILVITIIHAKEIFRFELYLSSNFSI